jgi:hypothetical protein
MTPRGPSGRFKKSDGVGKSFATDRRTWLLSAFPDILPNRDLLGGPYVRGHF